MVTSSPGAHDETPCLKTVGVDRWYGICKTIFVGLKKREKGLLDFEHSGPSFIMHCTTRLSRDIGSTDSLPYLYCFTMYKFRGGKRSE